MPRLSKPVPSSPSTSTASITLGDACDRRYASLAATDRIGSQRTIDAYRYGVSMLLTHVGADHVLADVQSQDMESLYADLKRQGIGRMAVHAPLRTFFGWCAKRGLVHASPMADVEAPRVKVITWGGAGVGNELNQLMGFGFKAILGATVLNFSESADGSDTNGSTVPRVLKFTVTSGISGA